MKNSGKALDENGLQELALRYVGRYATTRHKLAGYLTRKVRERGWNGDTQPDIGPMIERFVELGYIDDALFAKNKATALLNRGYGTRRVSQALYQAGIDESDGNPAIAISKKRKWDAARTYARKKSIGPFATQQTDRDQRQKQLQGFLRAGHSYDIASRFVFAKPGEEIDEPVP